MGEAMSTTPDPPKPPRDLRDIAHVIRQVNLIQEQLKRQREKK
jgi:hypothetical protein